MSNSSGYSCRSDSEQEVQEAITSAPSPIASTTRFSTFVSACRRASFSIPFANIGVPEHFCGGHHLVAEVLVHPYHRLADLRRVVVGVTAVEVGDALVGVLHLCAAAGLPPLAERLGGEVRERGRPQFRGPSRRVSSHPESSSRRSPAAAPCSRWTRKKVVREDAVPDVPRELLHLRFDELPASLVVHL